MACIHVGHQLARAGQPALRERKKMLSVACDGQNAKCAGINSIEIGELLMAFQVHMIVALIYDFHMAYIYLDDSKHHNYGFSLTTFVFCEVDPTEQVSQIFRRFGFDPSCFEFKSSTKMQGNRSHQKLRETLTHFIHSNCKIAVCVVGDDRKLGPAALSLLRNALSHPFFDGHLNSIYFDQGLFQSAQAAEKLVADDNSVAQCEFHFEQDSRCVLGIQLADLVAHTCSTMLKETLGHVTKKIVVNSPEDEAYHNLEVELGFAMWASLRYSFLSQNKSEPIDTIEFATLDVYPWGFLVDESANDQIKEAAIRRFAEVYLGCIH